MNPISKKISSFKLLILLFVIQYLSVACEKEIPFDKEVKTPKITLNSAFMPDSTWQVYLNRSLSVVDNGELSAITDATVSVMGSNGTNFTLNYNPEVGYYTSTALVEPNITYSVTASAQNYNTVTAQNTTPLPITILTVDTLSRPGPFEKMKVFRINFNDPSPVENFYQVSIYKLTRFIFFDFETELEIIVDNKSIVFITSNDISIDQRDEFHDYLTFSDELFNGSNKTLVCEFSSADDFNTENENFKYQVEIKNMSREMYNFRKSVLQYQMLTGNPFAEPVRVFSNIENGFGIFGGEAPAYYTLP